jgi:hypothetical protein
MLDDGAYVLGALSPAERAEFERHLATCGSCREAVAALAVLPGLLGRLDPASAIALAAGTPSPPPTPPQVLPRVLAAVGQQRRYERRKTRRRRTLFATTFALASLLLIVLVGGAVHMRDMQPSTPPVAMSAMRPAQEEWLQVGADIGLQPVDGGSQVIMKCWYSRPQSGSPTGNEGSDASYVMRLVVYDTMTRSPETVGTWTADPGATVTITGRTHLTPAQIYRVELQRADDNATLLWWSPN